MMDLSPVLLLTRKLLRFGLAAFYAGAGVVHLRSPELFVPIVPDWVPLPYETVGVTGICELVGAAGLLIPRSRRAAGLMLALYAVCVFPANVKHALDHVSINGMTLSWWYHGPRLLLQPVIVWLALFCGEVIVWPFGRKPHPVRSGSV